MLVQCFRLRVAALNEVHFGQRSERVRIPRIIDTELHLG
jgi:hypothetical protein